jgi:hypothetical protein
VSMASDGGSDAEKLPAEAPPVPPPAAPAAAAAAAAGPPLKKSRKKTPITDGEKQLAALRAERQAQRKKLAELRAATKKEKRACAKLNRKANRLTVGELLEVALLKFRSLTAVESTTDAEPTSSGGASSSAAPMPEEAVAFMAAHVKKQKAAAHSPVT